MPYSKRFYQSRRDDRLSLILSFFVIAAGFGAVVFMAVVASPEPVYAVLGAGAVFGFIGLATILAVVRAPRTDLRRGHYGTWREMWATAFRRREKPKPGKHRYWKKKKTDFIPEPFGTPERQSTFIPERPSNEPPSIFNR
ncbi:MAG: hypothetical protein ACRDD1_15440 [Planctomycetia bacterium]